MGTKKQYVRPPRKRCTFSSFSEEQKAHATYLASVGVPHLDIARILGCGVQHLEDNLLPDLQRGSAEANSKIAATLYNAAINGDMTALIWWSKTRMGWSEKTRIEIEGGILFGQVSESALSIDDWNKANAIDTTTVPQPEDDNDDG